MQCSVPETFRPHLERGALVALLDAFCPPFPGFFPYFPQRWNMPPKLRALIDYVKTHWDASRGPM